MQAQLQATGTEWYGSVLTAFFFWVYVSIRPATPTEKPVRTSVTILGVLFLFQLFGRLLPEGSIADPFALSAIVMATDVPGVAMFKLTSDWFASAVDYFKPDYFGMIGSQEDKARLYLWLPILAIGAMPSVLNGLKALAGRFTDFSLAAYTAPALESLPARIPDLLSGRAQSVCSFIKVWITAPVFLVFVGFFGYVSKSKSAWYMDVATPTLAYIVSKYVLEEFGKVAYVMEIKKDGKDVSVTKNYAIQPKQALLGLAGGVITKRLDADFVNFFLITHQGFGQVFGLLQKWVHSILTITGQALALLPEDAGKAFAHFLTGAGKALRQLCGDGFYWAMNTGLYMVGYRLANAEKSMAATSYAVLALTTILPLKNVALDHPVLHGLWTEYAKLEQIPQLASAVSTYAQVVLSHLPFFAAEVKHEGLPIDSEEAEQRANDEAARLAREADEKKSEEAKALEEARVKEEAKVAKETQEAKMKDEKLKAKIKEEELQAHNKADEEAAKNNANAKALEEQEAKLKKDEEGAKIKKEQEDKAHSEKEQEARTDEQQKTETEEVPTKRNDLTAKTIEDGSGSTRALYVGLVVALILAAMIVVYIVKSRQH